MLSKLCKWWLSRRGFKVLTASEWNAHVIAMNTWVKRASGFKNY